MPQILTMKKFTRHYTLNVYQALCPEIEKDLQTDTLVKIAEWYINRKRCFISKGTQKGQATTHARSCPFCRRISCYRALAASATRSGVNPK